MKKPPFQQIEATMLDAQWAVVSTANSSERWTTTSIDQHLEGYDRFNLTHPLH